MIATNALYAEIDRLRARVAELEAERDKLRDDLSRDKAILQSLLDREREEKRALEDAMTDLQAERDAAVKWLEEYKSKTYCAYCGATFNIDSDAAHVTEHIRTCPHHPMRELEAENERLREQYNSLIFEVSYKFPGESRHDTAKRYIREREEHGIEIVAKQALKEASHE